MWMLLSSTWVSRALTDLALLTLGRRPQPRPQARPPPAAPPSDPTPLLLRDAATMLPPAAPPLLDSLASGFSDTSRSCRQGPSRQRPRGQKMTGKGCHGCSPAVQAAKAPRAVSAGRDDLLAEGFSLQRGHWAGPWIRQRQVTSSRHVPRGAPTSCTMRSSGLSTRRSVSAMNTAAPSSRMRMVKVVRPISRMPCRAGRSVGAQELAPNSAALFKISQNARPQSRAA